MLSILQVLNVNIIVRHPFDVSNLFCFILLAKNRVVVSGVATSVCYISIFLASFTFPLLEDKSVLNTYGSFWLYSGIGLVGLLFVIFVFPQLDKEGQIVQR